MSLHHVALHKTRRWQAVRRAVFTRDGYRCRACGLPGALECDHLVPLDRDTHQDPYDLDGLQTLCRQCHIAKTRGENTRERTPAEQRWRDLVADMQAQCDNVAEMKLTRA